MKKKFEKGIILAAIVMLVSFGLWRGFILAKKAEVSGHTASQPIGLATTSKPVVPPEAKPPVDLANASPVDFAGLRIPVLMYHYIGELPQNADHLRRDLTVSSADFDAQMDYLQKNGYHTVTTSQLFLASEGQAALPLKPVIVTFDDGYTDTFQNAVPILEKKGMSGVFAVITQDQGQPSYADWETILSAHKGGMEIIPHTRTHIDFHDKKYTEAQRISEVQGSIQDIKNKLGVNPVSFVYPYGHFDKDIENILNETGIKFAFTTEYGFYQKSDNLLEVPRVRVHGNETMQRFEDLLLGRLNP